MEIKKEYKFYAAHRNQDLRDKCANLHGHKYCVSFFFKVKRNGNISTLFGDFDSKIEPHLKNNYDHGMLIDTNDVVYKALKETGESFRFKEFNRPTSVENLCFELFKEVTEMGFILDRIELKETDTSTILYSNDDYISDLEMFKDSSSTKFLYL